MRVKCKHCINTDDVKAYDEYMKKYPEASHCMFCGRYLLKNDYNRVEEVKIVDRSDTQTDAVEESHPSYAQLRFSRGGGGHPNLYGSPIQHQHTVTLVISKSVKYSSPYHDEYYDKEPLIEVVMSNAQFAEAITSFNLGGGVPVTLRYLRGQFMPLCGEVNRTQKINNDLKKTLREFADSIVQGDAKVNKILDKTGAINKGERSAIKGVYKKWVADLTSKIPFLHTCMTEAYEKVVANAKSEIEAFYIHGQQKIGIEDSAPPRLEISDSGQIKYPDANVVDAEYEDQDKNTSQE